MYWFKFYFTHIQYYGNTEYSKKAGSESFEILIVKVGVGKCENNICIFA